MNFYTSELQEVINQLSQIGIHGYWETLGLILKLLGLLAGPIAGIVFLIFCRVITPSLVTNLFVTEKKLAANTLIKIYSDNTINLDYLEDRINKKTTNVYFAASSVISILTAFFISPFLFINNELIRMIMIFVLVICILSPLIEAFFIDGSFCLFKTTRFKKLKKEVKQFYKSLPNEIISDKKKLKKELEKVFAGRVSEIKIL